MRFLNFCKDYARSRRITPHREVTARCYLYMSCPRETFSRSDLIALPATVSAARCSRLDSVLPVPLTCTHHVRRSIASSSFIFTFRHIFIHFSSVRSRAPALIPFASIAFRACATSAATSSSGDSFSPPGSPSLAPSLAFFFRARRTVRSSSE